MWSEHHAKTIALNRARRLAEAGKKGIDTIAVIVRGMNGKTCEHHLPASSHVLSLSLELYTASDQVKLDLAARIGAVLEPGVVVQCTGYQRHRIPICV